MQVDLINRNTTTIDLSLNERIQPELGSICRDPSAVAGFDRGGGGALPPPRLAI